MKFRSKRSVYMSLFLVVFCVLFCPFFAKPCYAYVGPPTGFGWVKIAKYLYESNKNKEPDSATSLGKVETDNIQYNKESVSSDALHQGSLKARSLGMDEEVYTEFSQSLNDFLDIIEYITGLVLGISILTSLVSLALQILKFGASPSHPIQKYRVMVESISCMISIALLGSSQLISTLIIEMVF